MSTTAPPTSNFRTTRIRPGYNAEEVNAFIEVVEDALRCPVPRVNSADVAGQRFTPVILKSGYHMHDVDSYLARAEHLLEERERLP